MKNITKEVAQVFTLGLKRNAFEIYILADRKADVIHRWLNENGVYPYMVTDNVDLMLDALIFASERLLLIVVDSGASVFSSAGQFQAMKELASIANKNKNICFLYTSDKLKSDVQFALGKNRSVWYTYEGTRSIVDCINEYHSYHIKGDPCSVVPNKEEILRSKIDQVVTIEPPYTSYQSSLDVQETLKNEAILYNGPVLKKEKLVEYNKSNLPIYNVEI